MVTTLSEEVVRKIKNVNSVIKNDKGVSFGDVTSCPGCGNKALSKGGSFLSARFSDLPLKFKVLFFSVTLGLTAKLEYCPNCGHLSLSFS